MGNQIRFRARLGADDWDRVAGVFRCSALAIPQASVNALHVAGAELAPQEYSVDLEAREIKLLEREPPAELLVSISIESKLTSLRAAGTTSGALALATALIAAVAQYATAVEPAKIAAQTAHAQLAAQVEKQRQCEQALSTRTPQGEGAEAASPQQVNTTHGHTSPIVHGSGTVSVHGR